MKKISLFKSLAILGAVTLTSVCVTETVLLLHNNNNNNSVPDNSELVNLNTYNNYTLAVTLDNAPATEIEAIDLLIREGIKHSPSEQTVYPFTDKEDINVTFDATHIFVSAKNNSSSYVQGSYASISYATPTKQTLASIFGSNPIIAYMDDKYDDDFTKAYILKSLQSQYSTLNINHLDVELVGYSQVNEGTATISVKTGSNLYEGSNAAVTYYTSGSAIMTMDKYLIKPGDIATPTFKFRNVNQTSTVTYTMPVAAQSGTFTWTGGSAGTLKYNTGNQPDWFGGSYEIVATCTPGDGNTYISRSLVYAQSNIAKGELKVTNSTINMTTKNSGTATYTVNGVAPSGGTASYTVSPTVASSNEGLSFNGDTGVLTWNGVTPTLGGQYTITCTYSGGTNKSSTGSIGVYILPQKDAFLTVTNSYITTGSLNSGTLAFTINGQAYTTNATYTTSGIPADQGISWNSTNRQVVWNGTTNTNGCVVTITASYTFNNQVIKAETKVTVAKSSLRKDGTYTINTDNTYLWTDTAVVQMGNTCSFSATFWLKAWGAGPLCTISGISLPPLSVYTVASGWTTSSTQVTIMHCLLSPNGECISEYPKVPDWSQNIEFRMTFTWPGVW